MTTPSLLVPSHLPLHIWFLILEFQRELDTGHLGALPRGSCLFTSASKTPFSFGQASILPVLQAPGATVLSLVTISPSPFSPSTCALQETVGDSSLRHPDPTHYPFTLETPPEKVAPGPYYP